MYTKVKTAHEIESMRRAGKQLATVLQYLKSEIQPGMTTKDLAILARNKLKTLGGKPSFLGYYGFPDVICISVNQEIVHGIPGDRVINNGDIVSLDFGVTIDDMVTDSAISVVAGTTEDQSINRLVSVTEEALMAGIKKAKDGVRVGEISSAIEAVLNKQHYGVVRELVGHGVGHQLHEEPNIPNYGKSSDGPVLRSGMTIAIEPMATLGSHQVTTKNDGWTVESKDSSMSPHFEHTILITDNGSEILTKI
ncbi:type I methionyl aminopeptidase [Candidatus Saccharibacteria bacterium]|nr:type I methionyl aminopeptidase [Candidatus Saccharibacteria bacterium]